MAPGHSVLSRTFAPRLHSETAVEEPRSAKTREVQDASALLGRAPITLMCIVVAAAIVVPIRFVRGGPGLRLPMAPALVRVRTWVTDPASIPLQPREAGPDPYQSLGGRPLHWRAREE